MVYNGHLNVRDNISLIYTLKDDSLGRIKTTIELLLDRIFQM